MLCFCFFFFQAEDGIRYGRVTGVQTCALPIYPSWNGYSTAKWDRDTLVVETKGFHDGMWLDRFGSPMTDAAKVTERFRRTNYGYLEIEVTMDDPKAYTKPWTVKVNEVIMLNTELMDYICAENEKDIRH